MIRWPERPRPPADRLLAGAPADGPVTLVLAFETRLAPAAVPALAAGADRLLVIGWLGTHRDARAPELRRQWDVEEAARATSLPTLALRIGPLIGPTTPLWTRLARGSAAIPEDRLWMPLVEDDAIETLRRAFAADRWDDWYEVGGPEPASVGELVDWAAGGRRVAQGGRGGNGGGSWEPSLDVLREQRLADPAPWLERFGLAPAPLAERVRAWAV